LFCHGCGGRFSVRRYCILYYLFIVIAAGSFFRRHKKAPRDFTPPLSLLNPFMGLTRKLRKFCQLLPTGLSQYEILLPSHRRKILHPRDSPAHR